MSDDRKSKVDSPTKTPPTTETPAEVVADVRRQAAVARERLVETAKPEPLTSRFPTDGRQNAFKSYTSASLCARQIPETFGGVSTD